MSRHRASRFPDPHADRPPLLVAVLLGLQLGLQPGQSREPQIGHVMMMVRVLVEVDAALRAQSPAVLAAQGLQWQRLHQRVTQQRLQVGGVPRGAQPTSQPSHRMQIEIEIHLGYRPHHPRIFRRLDRGKGAVHVFPQSILQESRSLRRLDRP